MPLIVLHTRIRAPRERVFDLARSIDAHTASTPGTAERAVAGVTSGLIGPGGQVTWRARHFGVVQHLTVRITAFDRPRHFQDTMLRGAFASMRHDHDFAETDADGVTLMTDRFDFAAPLGPLGRLAETLFLTRYMRRFLETRNALLKRCAESDEWTRYLPPRPERVNFVVSGIRSPAPRQLSASYVRACRRRDIRPASEIKPATAA